MRYSASLHFNQHINLSFYWDFINIYLYIANCVRTRKNIN